MALPQWNQVGVNFSGSGQSMANATRNIGNVGDIANSMINQKSKEDELALRNQQLSMQQAAENRANEQFGILKDEKNAANQYAGLLRSATDGNVVGIQDQAKLAAISQDSSLTPEQRANVIGNVLPTMTKKYEVNPDSQLQVLRSMNAPSNINPATGIALLKEAEQPMEKMQALNASHAAKLQEEKMRADERLQQQKMMYGLQSAMKNAEIASRTTEGRLNRENQMALKKYESTLPAYTGDVEGVNKVLTPNDLMRIQTEGGTVSNLLKIGGHAPSDGSSGSGTGGTHSKKGSTPVEGSIETASGITIPKQGILGFTGDQEETARVSDKLVASGYNKDEVQRAVNTQGTLNWDAGLKTGNIDKFLPPKVLGDGTLISPSIAVQMSDMLGKEIYSDKAGKLKFTKGNRELTSDDVEKLGFRKIAGKDDKGNKTVSFMPAPDYDLYTGTSALPDFGNQSETRSSWSIPRPYVADMFNEAQDQLRNRTPNTLLKYK